MMSLSKTTRNVLLGLGLVAAAGAGGVAIATTVDTQKMEHGGKHHAESGGEHDDKGKGAHDAKEASHHGANGAGEHDKSATATTKPAPAKVPAPTGQPPR